MKDEIKEIDNSDLMELLETTSKKDFYRLTLDHELVVRLYNWITNLQEENERLTRFKYNIPNDKTTSVPTITKSYKKEYENYKSRCEKAIEWVKKHIETYQKNEIVILDWDNFSDPRKLLKILGGDE